MAPRFVLPKRLPITASFAAKRTPAFARFNSSSSTSTAERIVEMARQAEKPSALEASVPIMWLVSGAFIYTAFQRAEKGEDHVEKLLIV
ncbi:hypothetical protein K491DRAFT_713373 [Lophiostoma macrostomum CBS 122681]|uniref:Uncharacterized protein n=1 Tax=Lophiostoma macrostomum CBS 122681 TaxID=1314788 RepID=A0A6A6TIB4_9PLEO|nr:hypothetical protein K491DRAFT_713373 [Lophiostoma macrostomum CBS 122681]